MTRILYLTDPGISARYHVDLLGKFVAEHSKKQRPDLLVVSGDYIDFHELLEQKMFKALVNKKGFTEEAARRYIEDEKLKPGIRFFKPSHPTIPEPWYSEDQMHSLYSDMIKTLELNSESPIILNAGNHDVKDLQDAVKDSSSGRVFNPEFNLIEINGLYVTGIPGSREGIRFLDVPNYTWDSSIEFNLTNLTRKLSYSPRVDIMITHMPPQVYDKDRVIGYGCDRIPDWDLFERERVITTQGNHVGYPIIRKIVEIANPKIILSGHIEEARHVKNGLVHAGAIDKIGNSVLVNPGGFWPNWFEKEPVAALIDYNDEQVNSVSFIAGSNVVSNVSDFKPNCSSLINRSLEDLL